MQLLKVDDLEMARSKLKERFGQQLIKCEAVPVEESLGHIVAEDVYCEIMIPQFRRSTVDGYAVVASNTQGASESIPVFLKMMEDVEIGEEPTVTIKDGQCSYVPTGGMLPEGANAMVMVEYSDEFTVGEMALYKGVAVGANVVQIGEDLEIGEVVVKKGAKVRGQEIGALCAAGVKSVQVFKPLTIAIISTGNELVSMEQPLVDAKVKDVNTYAIAGLAEELGMKVVHKTLVQDEENQIRSALEEAMELVDLVVISGGSSKGKKDMTEQLIDEVSSQGVFTHGLALKPGKPTIMGWDEASKSLFLGLPGHPVAAMMVFRLLMEWLQDDIYGCKRSYPTQAIMETNLAGAPGRQTCILVELVYDSSYIARPILGKSGLISILSRAYGYVMIEKNTEGVKAGEIVNVWPV
ncbi:MAG: molybdopterin molybdotransferase MoeA [Eubacteriales bacterium]